MTATVVEETPRPAYPAECMRVRVRIESHRMEAPFGRSKSQATEKTRAREGPAGCLEMPPTTLLTIRASRLARLHTLLSFTAFIGALVVASSLHYTKVVKNAVAGWPEEWFPSVSAT